MADSGSTPGPVNPSDQITATSLAQQLSFLLTSLLQASRATSDPTKLIQLNSEMAAVQTVLNQAAQAQAATNDATFAQAAATLNAQAGVLSGMEAQITTIIADAATAGRAIGYITQALALIAKL